MRVYDHQTSGHSWNPPPPPNPPPKRRIREDVKINKDFLKGVMYGVLLTAVADIILLCILARGV